MTPKALLLVEDDPNDVFFFRHALEQAEIRNSLNVVQDGQEAVDYFSGAGKFSDRSEFPLPALVILDLKLPRKSGMEVLEWLRKQREFRSLPVVVFTSSAHREDIERAYELGANAFVVKPPGVKKRMEFAKCLESFWLEFNESPPPSNGTKNENSTGKKRRQSLL
jgi:CheY-like chemotaxis protein